MDPITHVVSGAVIGKALKSKYHYSQIISLCVISAIIPDIDNLTGFISPEMFLIHHRGITHSFAGGLLVALLVSSVFRLLSPVLAFKKALLVSYSLILVHISLDLITSFGTQIMYPFSMTRYALSSVFIIDPLFTSILLLLFLFSVILKKRAVVFSASAAIFLLFYPMANLGIKNLTQKYINERLNADKIKHEKVIIEPEFLSPVFWKVIVEDNNHYMLSSLSLLDLKTPIKFDVYQKADMARILILAEKAAIFKTFAWFAVYPIMNLQEHNNLEKIYFGDLRFYSALPIIKKYNDKNGIPFSLSASLDEYGNLISWEYYRHQKQKVIEYVE